MNGARDIPVKVKPILHLSEEDIPDLGDVRVGDNIRLEISGKLKGISENEVEKNKKLTEYTFEIQNAEVISGLKKTGAGQTLESRLVAE